jgi:hypothetical protein
MKWNALAGSDPGGRVSPSTALAALLGLTLLELPGLASAAEPSLRIEPAPAGEAQGGPAVRSHALHSARLLAALSVGKGLRFNNPYRLATPLGDTAESVSLSATYLDAALGVLLPAVPRIEHGPTLDVVLALDGIGQLGLTPSYLLLFEPNRSFGLRGRLGLPLVVAPDASLGLEAALGAQLPVAYGFGLTGEFVGSLFFGAATEQKSVTTIPMLAFQIGFCFDERVVW